MTDKTDKPISLRLPQRLRREVDRRVAKSREDGETASDAAGRVERDPDHEYGWSAALRGALDRYYEICRRHAPTTWLSRAELAIVCDVVNGGLLWIDGESQLLHVRALWHEVADAIALSSRPPLGRDGSILAKHERNGEHVDGDELVRKLQAASFADLAALADFVERFWADDEATEREVWTS